MRWILPGVLCSCLLGPACGPGIDPFGLDAGVDGLADADGGPTLDGDAPLGGDPSGGDPVADGGQGDGPGADADPASPCTWTELAVSCPHRSDWLATGYPGLDDRRVYWQIPVGPPPAGGYPVAVFFQGAAFPAGLVFSGLAGEAYGAYYQAGTIARLLEAGFAVLAPEAHLSGTTFWDTNTAAWAMDWDASPDRAMMDALLAAIDAGRFGSLDPNDLSAFGFSSGGYMTSRVGLAYPDRFRALAVCSGAYATCAGAACQVPAAEAGHPATLFLHGLLDPVVPEWTMRLYEQSLRQAGVPTRIVTDALAGHQWLEAAPEAIPEWFGPGP